MGGGAWRGDVLCDILGLGSDLNLGLVRALILKLRGIYYINVNLWTWILYSLSFDQNKHSFLEIYANWIIKSYPVNKFSPRSSF